MKFLFSLALTVCAVALIDAASPVVQGRCPELNGVQQIANLNKMMILWWRPFRSQFNNDEPRFKCLSTEWSDLSKTDGRTFKVIDNNVDAFTNDKTTWNGFIEANATNNAFWHIKFDATANNMEVDAVVLDEIESEYLFMYVCVPAADGSNTHTQNGIIFTREKHVPYAQMDVYLKRASKKMADHDLKHIQMLPIFFNDCPS